MRIAHIISSLSSSSGGPPVVAGSLAIALSSLGHDVTLIGGVDRHEEYHSAIAGLPEIDQVNLIEYDALTKKIKGFFDTTVFNLIMKQDRFDVIHFHGVWCTELLHVARAAKKSSSILVVTPHGMLDNWSLLQSRFRKKVALSLYVKKIFKESDVVHVLNEHEKSCIEQLGIRSNIQVLGNGVFSSYVRKKVETKVAGVESQDYFLFLSRLHIKKGLDYLAKAWVLAQEHVQDVKLIVAGPEEDDSLSVFREIINTAGLCSTVDVVGSVYGNKKYELIKFAKGFVLPSRQEGFSVAIIEALAQGIPVVISQQCNFPEVAKAQAGIVCELNEQEIARGIVRLFHNDQLRKSMGENAIKLVSSNYTWEAIACGLLDYYSEAISKKHK